MMQRSSVRSGPNQPDDHGGQQGRPGRNTEDLSGVDALVGRTAVAMHLTQNVRRGGETSCTKTDASRCQPPGGGGHPHLGLFSLHLALALGFGFLPGGNMFHARRLVSEFDHCVNFKAVGGFGVTLDALDTSSVGARGQGRLSVTRRNGLVLPGVPAGAVTTSVERLDSLAVERHWTGGGVVAPHESPDIVVPHCIDLLAPERDAGLLQLRILRSDTELGQHGLLERLQPLGEGLDGLGLRLALGPETEELRAKLERGLHGVGTDAADGVEPVLDVDDLLAQGANLGGGVGGTVGRKGREGGEQNGHERGQDRDLHGFLLIWFCPNLGGLRPVRAEAGRRKYLFSPTTSSRAKR